MFTKKELSFVTIVVFLVAAVTVVNLFASYKKSRDNRRKNALGDVESRLSDFKKTIGKYPLATSDGKIIGCNGHKNLNGEWVFKACEWGDNKINSSFFDPLPIEPYVAEGRAFFYISSGQAFQVFTSLEGSYEEEYDKNIIQRNINCGNTVCNAGRTNLEKASLYSPLPPLKN